MFDEELEIKLPPAIKEYNVKGKLIMKKYAFEHQTDCIIIDAPSWIVEKLQIAIKKIIDTKVVIDDNRVYITKDMRWEESDTKTVEEIIKEIFAYQELAETEK